MKVYVGLYTHRHGTDVEVYASSGQAAREFANIIRTQFWADRLAGEPPEDDWECIDEYFEVVEDEHFEVVERALEPENAPTRTPADDYRKCNSCNEVFIRNFTDEVLCPICR